MGEWEKEEEEEEEDVGTQIDTFRHSEVDFSVSGALCFGLAHNKKLDSPMEKKRREQSVSGLINDY